MRLISRDVVSAASGGELLGFLERNHIVSQLLGDAFNPFGIDTVQPGDLLKEFRHSSEAHFCTKQTDHTANLALASPI